MVEKMENKGLKLHKKTKLTKAENAVLHLLTDEFLTIKKIALQRECSIQAVYKIIKKLKEKGAYDLGLKKVEKVQPTFNQTDIRLHGQEFNIKILWQDNKYQELLEKSNVLFLDGNTIRLYKNSIEIYSGQSFYGKESAEAEKNSLEYLNRFLARLEHDLKINLIKQRSRNIRVVNQHYARGDSEICDNATKERKRIWIYAEEDGKLAYITDDSFGMREDETVHTKTAKPDREAIDKQINDWRLNNPPTNSQLAVFQAETNNHINKSLEVMQGIQKNQLVFDKNMSSHLRVLNKIEKAIDKLNKTISKKNKKIKLGMQSTLNDF
jgi:biotin operon repressor